MTGTRRKLLNKIKRSTAELLGPCYSKEWFGKSSTDWKTRGEEE